MKLSQRILGVYPYVLIQVPEEGHAEVDAGGVDVSDPAELRYLAKATRAAARGLRRQARAVAKAKRKDARHA